MKTTPFAYRYGLIVLGFLLAGCGALGKSTPAALPTVVLDSSAPTSVAGQASGGLSGRGLAASGVVAPAQESRLASPVGGVVETLDAAVGDQVAAGQTLVKLSGAERLDAAIAAANLELLAAQQELLNARSARQDLERNLPQAQTNALQALNDARQAVKDAQRKAAGLSSGASQADLQEAEATLILAKDQLDKAQKDYKQFENAKENNVYRAASLNRLSQAQRAYDNALRRYNNLHGGSTEFYRSQTLAELDIANARLAQAQKDYDTLQQGPRPEEVELADKRIQTAEGRIAAAEAAIQSAQASLSDLELKAPFDGVIGQLNVHLGEWVAPGQLVAVLADVQNLRVQTTDLSERDVPGLELGQPVSVFIEALNQTVAGTLSQISPLADTLGGDVVYQTTIDLDEIPAGLRPGMSVDVQFEDTP